MRQTRVQLGTAKSPLSLAIFTWFALIATALLAARQKGAPPSMKGLLPHWTGIYDATGRCRYGIPPTWRSEGPHGYEISRAPDGSAMIGLTWVASSSWASYKTDVRRRLKPTAVGEDTAQRFSLEYSAGWPGDHLFVAVPAVTGACATQIDIGREHAPHCNRQFISSSKG